MRVFRLLVRNCLARFVSEVFPCRNFGVFVPLQLVNENKEEIVPEGDLKEMIEKVFKKLYRKI